MFECGCVSRGMFDEIGRNKFVFMHFCKILYGFTDSKCFEYLEKHLIIFCNSERMSENGAIVHLIAIMYLIFHD